GRRFEQERQDNNQRDTTDPSDHGHTSCSRVSSAVKQSGRRPSADSGWMRRAHPRDQPQSNVSSALYEPLARIGNEIMYARAPDLAAWGMLCTLRKSHSAAPAASARLVHWASVSPSRTGGLVRMISIRKRVVAASSR